MSTPIPDKVLLKFTRYCAPYNSGELAQLPRDAALRVISAGSAVAVTKEDPATACPIIMREVQAMHRAQLLQMGVDPDTIERAIAVGIGPLEAAKVTVAGLGNEIARREAKEAQSKAKATAMADPEPVKDATDENATTERTGDSAHDGDDGKPAETGKRKK